MQSENGFLAQFGLAPDLEPGRRDQGSLPISDNSIQDAASGWFYWAKHHGENSLRGNDVNFSNGGRRRSSI